MWSDAIKILLFKHTALLITLLPLNERNEWLLIIPILELQKLEQRNHRKIFSPLTLYFMNWYEEKTQLTSCFYL